MKSASFGTSVFVRYRGMQSPDLTCSSADAAKTLSSDIQKVTQELGITALRRYDGMRQTHILPSPSPTPKT